MVLDANALVVEATCLAPLPRSTLPLVSIFSRDDWTPEEVIDVVRHDPVLTGKVLGFANSALSGAQSSIRSVEEAVRRIGPRAVVGIAIASGAKGYLFRALPQLGIEEGELWRHSVCSLVAAELAAPLLRIPYSSVAVTAALLHDVGKVVVARFLDRETVSYLQMARIDGRQSAHAAEMEILGVTHGELGALIATHWGLPEDIARTIQYHHDLENVPHQHRRDVCLVQLAHTVAAEVAPPRVKPPLDVEERDAALSFLDVTIDALDDFRDAVASHFRQVEAAY